MITLDSGDLFERTHAQWLESHLPSYQKIWASFIGNDGANSALPIEGLDKDRDTRRGRFAQAHYSLAITVFHLHAIKDSDLERVFPPKPSLDQFLTGHAALFSFMGHVGHVRDMFLQMQSALGVGDRSLSGDFQGFYDQRSHVIHGPQIPTLVDELSWLIPPIADGNESAGQWHKNAHWDTVKASKGNVYVGDFIRGTCAELFRLIADIHPRVYDAADRFFEGRRIVYRVHHGEPEAGHLFLSDGSSSQDISISAGSSTYKIRRIPSGQRDSI